MFTSGTPFGHSSSHLPLVHCCIRLICLRCDYFHISINFLLYLSPKYLLGLRLCAEHFRYIFLNLLNIIEGNAGPDFYVQRSLIICSK